MDSKKYKMIKDYLNNLADDQLIEIHNEYCWATNSQDDLIFSIDDFDYQMKDQEPIGIINELAIHTNCIETELVGLV